MAKLTDQTYKIQMLYIGDSGTGKTGSLLSLVEAGYRIFLIDLENGSKILRSLVQSRCPERMDQVEVEHFFDPYAVSQTGPRLKGVPSALMKCGKQIDDWTRSVDWGPKDVLVLDSLTALGRAALAVAKAQNPQTRDHRLHVGNAQALLEPYLHTLTSADVPYNLIVITHIAYKEVRDAEGRLLEHRNFPSAIGQALPERLPQAFNDCYAAVKIGSGAAAKRQIVSVSPQITGLKSSAPDQVQKSYPLETGLADIFKLLAN